MPDFALSSSSDSRGNFAISCIPAGTVDLVARSPRFLEEEVDGIRVAGDQVKCGIRILLERGGRLGGWVRDRERRPVRDAEVLVTEISERAGLETHRALTGGDGRFQVEGLRSQDTVDLEVRHPRHDRWSRGGVAVKSGDLEVVLLPSPR
jgi:hypothetical protein